MTKPLFKLRTACLSRASMLCPWPYYLWTWKGLQQSPWQASASWHSHPLFTLPVLCSAAPSGWPQTTYNSTDSWVNWLLTEFANGRHRKEIGEGAEESQGISPLPFYLRWWEAPASPLWSSSQQIGPLWLQVPPGDPTRSPSVLQSKGGAGSLMLLISVLPHHRFGF